MAAKYPIVDVPVDARDRDEQMGSKRKFWYFERSSPSRRWLFKYKRAGTGEDWAEKVAAEIAEILQLPHAQVELASCDGEPGVISLDFTDDRRRGRLVHGNELLMEHERGYQFAGTYHVAQHTVERVLRRISDSFIHLPAGFQFDQRVKTPADLFVGYLLLDGLIGNTDRHHENWGVLEHDPPPGELRRATLAPTFDHASSLGRELIDSRRRQILLGGPSSVQGYCERARSAFYREESDKRPLRPIEAFVLAAEQHRAAAGSWLEMLAALDEETRALILQRVPESCMTETTRDFALAVLSYNYKKLLSLTP